MAAEKSSGSSSIELRPVTVFAVTLAAAALLYSFHLAHDPLGASEAYSAYAATRPGIRSIAGIPLLDDPGKQLLYYIALHYWTLIFGSSEGALRAMSAAFGIASLGILYLLGRDLFDDAAGAAAVAIWAFCPLAVIFAHRARMYTMLVALALAHVFAFRRTRTRSSSGWIVASAVTGAAIMYTHLGAALIIGAEFAILIRDITQGRRSFAPWIGVGGAVLLFSPYLPIAAAQSHVLLAGRPLAYLGVASLYPAWVRITVALASVAFGLWAVFGRRFEAQRDEPFRFCLLWIAFPIIAFVAGSIVVRPLFQIRYVSPALAMLAIAVAGALALRGSWVRNLAVAGLALVMASLSLATRPTSQPWGAAARMVEESGAPEEPVFFEAGFVSTGNAPSSPDRGYPKGFYSLPFNFYFHGENPRVTVQPSNPAAARAEIQSAVVRTGGAWLASWLNDAAARNELPHAAQFIATIRLRGERMAFYRITRAIGVPPGQGGTGAAGASSGTSNATPPTRIGNMTRLSP